MEIRNSRIIVGSAGGTAGRTSKTYKISLPSAWLSQMEIGEEEREVLISFDGNQITIRKMLSFSDFIEKKKQMGHDLKLFRFFDGESLCTSIAADFTDQTVSIKNEKVSVASLAFGRKENPSWEDLVEFLEERCIPRQRDGIRYYLEELGLDEYDPFEIVLKTEGRMAEDGQWMKVEDL